MRIALLLGICFYSLSASAQLPSTVTQNSKQISSDHKLPLANILNPDGSIITGKGVSGSYNAEGYSMSYSDDGQPYFIPKINVAGDEKWDSVFSKSGLGFNAGGRCVAISGDTVYVGGGFTEAGGIPVHGFARWTPSGWSSMGYINSHQYGNVLSVAVQGHYVYAGSEDGVHRWDGTNWTLIGSITANMTGNKGVFAMDTDASGNLYVAGPFNTINGVVVNSIAKWNGNTWLPLGSGMTGYNYALDVEVKDNTVYVAGPFDVVGGVMASKVARWDGSSWSALGSGITGTGVVSAIVLMGNDLYAAGNALTSAGGVPINNIAKWNGSSWSSVGNGLNETVHSLVVFGNELYAGGNMTLSGTTPINGVARWNGSSWVNAGQGLHLNVSALAINARHFIAMGNANDPGLQMHGIARWNGDEWRVIGHGLDNFVNCITVDGDNVYVGGFFTEAGGVVVNRIAKWDGQKWDSLGPGFISGQVYDIVVWNGQVYAGGSFNVDYFGTIRKIARWDGNSWTAVGSGIAGSTVFALVAQGNSLYAAGDFNEAGGIPVNNIAKWDGTNWSPLGGITLGIIKDLKIGPDNLLYAAGNFTYIGGVSAKRVAKWNGAAWSQVGDGLQDIVNVIAFSPGNELYAGGQFTNTGNGVTVRCISKFNGTTWVAVGQGMTVGPPTVYSIAFHGTDMYVAGGFQKSGTVVTNSIARWDGNNWHPLGSGVGTLVPNGIVTALGIKCNQLYVGGYFSIAGERIASRFTRYALDGMATASISTANPSVCQGTTVNFTSSTSISNPVYQWKLNGVNAGTNSSVFSSNTLNNNDQVKLLVNGSSACAAAESNVITMNVNPVITPAVSISSDYLDSCVGHSFNFTATALHAGTAPVYQWQLNGVNAGTNNSTFSTPALSANAQVKLVLTSSAACTTTPTAHSNIVNLTIHPMVTPSVSIGGVTTVNPGQSTTLTATPVSGGSAPMYQWVDSTGANGWQPISGANGATLNYTPLATGHRIGCVMRSSLPCKSDPFALSNVLQFTVNSTTAILDPAADYGISASPNPAKEKLMIRNLSPQAQWQTVEVVDMLGRKRMTQKLPVGQQTFELPVDKLEAGVYSLVIRSKSGKGVYLRFVKRS